MIGDGDLELIFESGDFDTSASFATTPTATVIRGWFNDGTSPTTLFGQQIEAQTPSFVTPTENLTTAMKAFNLAVTINAIAYKVMNVVDLGPVGVSEVQLRTP